MDIATNANVFNGEKHTRTSPEDCAVADGPLVTAPSVPNLLAHLAASLTLIHSKVGGSDVEEVLSIILDTRFDIAQFRREVSSLQDCERLTSGGAKQIVDSYLCLHQ